MRTLALFVVPAALSAAGTLVMAPTAGLPGLFLWFMFPAALVTIVLWLPIYALVMCRRPPSVIEYLVGGFASTYVGFVLLQWFLIPEDLRLGENLVVEGGVLTHYGARFIGTYSLIPAFFGATGALVFFFLERWLVRRGLTTPPASD